MNQERLLQAIEEQRRKDLIEVEIEKAKFAKLVKNKIGKDLNNFDTYIKPEPSFFERIKAKVIRFFKYI